MTQDKRKPIIVLVVLIVLLIIGLVIFKPKQAQLIPQPQVVDTTVTEQVVNDEADVYEVKVKYPQFVGVTQEFNDSIKRAATLDIEEFKKIAVADRQIRLEMATTDEEREQIETSPWKYGYHADYTIIQNNDKYISVLMHQDGFTGGAHGYDVIHTFNYDRTQNKILSLADFYPNDPTYLQSLSEISKAQLRAKLGEEWYVNDMATAGTEPTIENFSQFTFTDTQLVIYFQQYQVGPYAIGQQTVEVGR